MPTIRANDLLIAFDHVGTGDRPLVLVHGNWASKRWWQPVMRRLPAAYRAVAFDLRGCGATLGLDHGYTIAEHAADLRALLDALDITRAVLVGHSLGSAIVTQFALLWPHRVQALALVGPAPLDGMQIDAQVYSHLPLLKQNRWLMAQALGSTMPGVPNGAFREALIDDAMRARLTAVMGNGRALERWNVAAQVRHLRLPTLIMRGEDDRLIARAQAERWRQCVAGSRLVTIQRCGHSPNVERPDVFTRALFEFLEDRRAGEKEPIHL